MSLINRPDEPWVCGRCGCPDHLGQGHQAMCQVCRRTVLQVELDSMAVAFVWHLEASGW
jgi:hypothetical protein